MLLLHFLININLLLIKDFISISYQFYGAQYDSHKIFM